MARLSKKGHGSTEQKQFRRPQALGLSCRTAYSPLPCLAGRTLELRRAGSFLINRSPPPQEPPTMRRMRVTEAQFALPAKCHRSPRRTAHAEYPVAAGRRKLQCACRLPFATSWQKRTARAEYPVAAGRCKLSLRRGLACGTAPNSRGPCVFRPFPLHQLRQGYLTSLTLSPFYRQAALRRRVPPQPHPIGGSPAVLDAFSNAPLAGRLHLRQAKGGCF